MNDYEMDAETYLQTKFCPDVIKNIVYHQYDDVGYIRLVGNPWVINDKYLTFNPSNGIPIQHFTLNNQEQFISQLRAFLSAQTNQLFDYYHRKYWPDKTSFDTMKDIGNSKIIIPTNITDATIDTKTIVPTPTIRVQDIGDNNFRTSIKHDIRSFYWLMALPYRTRYNLDNVVVSDNELQEYAMDYFCEELVPIQSLSNTLSICRDKEVPEFCPSLFYIEQQVPPGEETLERDAIERLRRTLFLEENPPVKKQIPNYVVRPTSTSAEDTVIAVAKGLLLSGKLYKSGTLGDSGMPLDLYLIPIPKGRKIKNGDDEYRYDSIHWDNGGTRRNIVFITQHTADKISYHRYFYEGENLHDIPTVKIAWGNNTLKTISKDKFVEETTGQYNLSRKCLFTKDYNGVLKTKQDENITFVEGTTIFSGAVARGHKQISPTGMTGPSPPTTAASLFFSTTFATGVPFKLSTVQMSNNGQQHFVFEYTHTQNEIDFEDANILPTLDSIQQFLNVDMTTFLKIARIRQQRFQLINKDNVDERLIRYDDQNFSMDVQDEKEQTIKLKHMLVTKTDVATPNGTNGRYYISHKNKKTRLLFANNTFSIESRFKTTLREGTPTKQIKWDAIPNCTAVEILRRDFDKREYGGTDTWFPSNHIHPFIMLIKDIMQDGTNHVKPFGIVLRNNTTNNNIGVFIQHNLLLFSGDDSYEEQIELVPGMNDARWLNITQQLSKVLGTYEKRNRSWNAVQGKYISLDDDIMIIQPTDFNTVYNATFEEVGDMRTTCPNLGEQGIRHTFSAQIRRGQVGSSFNYICPVNTLLKESETNDEEDNPVLSRKVMSELGLSGGGNQFQPQTSSLCWFCGSNPCKRERVTINLSSLNIL